MKYNSWIVLGPVRTGSLVIANKLFFSAPELRYRAPDISPRAINNPELIHSHDLNWLNYAADDTGVVISIRNPIESALSWCILPKFGQTDGAVNYHFFNHTIKKFEELQNNIEPFDLNIDKFLEAFSLVNMFYSQIEVKDHYYIMDYANWSSDTTKILNQLDIAEPRTVPILTKTSVPVPLKNPGSHKQWIRNWEELMKVSETLSLEKYTQLCQRKHW